MRTPGWAVVVPIKPLARAKTRLRGAVIGLPHPELVLAMVSDTVAAVRDCPMVGEVLVVTDDPVVGRALAGTDRVRVVPDRPAAGLNPALSYGAELVSQPERWVAALTADLPALRPWELAGAFGQLVAAGGRGFVADAAGTGTTLLATPPGVALAPRFGPGSAGAHARSGARALVGGWPSLRRDVDTVADLVAAARLGLGRRTAVAYQRRAGSSMA